MVQFELAVRIKKKRFYINEKISKNYRTTVLRADVHFRIILCLRFVGNARVRLYRKLAFVAFVFIYKYDQRRGLLSFPIPTLGLCQPKEKIILTFGI